MVVASLLASMSAGLAQHRTEGRPTPHGGCALTTPATSDYARLIESLKARVHHSRLRAALSVNQELVLLYWHIGRELLVRRDREGWGAKVIDRLSRDLCRAFPDMRGFSPRNLRSMQAFAAAWPDEQIVKQTVSRLPWGHNVRLLQKVKDPDQRLWYARAAIHHGWSRDILVHQVDTRLHERSGAAPTNFAATLPSPQSDLAQQVTKDPYCFDFLTLSADARERDLEGGLIAHIRDFLLELGVGFAFMGTQVPVKVGDHSFALDMLFYHVALRAYVVIELKAGGFKPEYAGKLNFYLSAVDDTLKRPDDQPSIGLLLCRDKDDVVVEYALRGMSQPIGVAEWQAALVHDLPENLRGRLPSVEEVERELFGIEE